MKEFFSNEPKTFDEILTKSIKINNLEEKLLFGKIVNNWQLIIGDTLSQKCKPMLLLSNKLKLKAIDSLWRFELNLQKAKILENVNKFSGCEHINEIEIL